jgi:Fuc2NAc and GlcNAc transferase
MGDVGSGYLGYIFGVFAVAGERSGGVPILAWVALLALFVADATLTLVRRVLRGEAWHAAHRTHAYQRAVDLWGRHARVTGVCLMLTLPLAALAWWGSLVPTQLGLALVFALLLAGGAYVLVERRRPMRT